MSWPEDVYLQIETWSLSEPKNTTIRATISILRADATTDKLTRNDEDLDRQNDEHVVDVEPRVAVVERQETVDGELRAEVVVLATEHLLAHTRADLRREVQDRAKAEVSALAALVVLRVLDASATSEGVHTGVDILV